MNASKRVFRRAAGRQALSAVATAKQPLIAPMTTTQPTMKPASQSQKPTAVPAPVRKPSEEEEEDEMLPQSVSEPSASLEPELPAKPAPKALSPKYYLILAQEGQHPICQEYATESELTDQLQEEVRNLSEAAERDGGPEVDTRMFVFVGHIAELGTFPRPKLFLPPLFEGEEERAVKLYQESEESERRSRSGSLFGSSASDQRIYRASDVGQDPHGDDEEDAEEEESSSEEQQAVEEPSMANLMDVGGEIDIEDDAESLGD